VSDAYPCPICGKPISDTAYVCHRCTLDLARRLLNAAHLWREVEVTLSRQAVVEAQRSASPTTALAYAGPYCRPWCEHESCRRAADSQSAAAMRALDEPYLVNEAALPFHYAAAEVEAVVGNTVTTWARHVSQERGVPIPVPTERALADDLIPTVPSKDKRCPMSDLLLNQCACPLDHEEKAR